MPDYRVKYYDVPWSVVLGVFFSKLGWTLAKPFRLKKKTYWRILKFSVLSYVFLMTVAVAVDMLLNYTYGIRISDLFKELIK